MQPFSTFVKLSTVRMILYSCRIALSTFLYSHRIFWLLCTSFEIFVNMGQEASRVQGRAVSPSSLAMASASTKRGRTDPVSSGEEDSESREDLDKTGTKKKKTSKYGGDKDEDDEEEVDGSDNVDDEEEEENKGEDDDDDADTKMAHFADVLANAVSANPALVEAFAIIAENGTKDVQARVIKLAHHPGSSRRGRRSAAISMPDAREESLDVRPILRDVLDNLTVSCHETKLLAVVAPLSHAHPCSLLTSTTSVGAVQPIQRDALDRVCKQAEGRIALGCTPWSRSECCCHHARRGGQDNQAGDQAGLRGVDEIGSCGG